MVQLVLNLSLFFKFYYWFCHLDCHFLSVEAGCDGCHAWGRQRLLNPEHLVVLSAGPIPHNSIHLLIVTTDFVALYWFATYVVFIIISFLAGVESEDQCFLNPNVLFCFSGVIMSIRSFFLLCSSKVTRIWSCQNQGDKWQESQAKINQSWINLSHHIVCIVIRRIFKWAMAQSFLVTTNWNFAYKKCKIIQSW